MYKEIKKLIVMIVILLGFSVPTFAAYETYINIKILKEQGIKNNQVHQAQMFAMSQLMIKCSNRATDLYHLQ